MDVLCGMLFSRAPMKLSLFDKYYILLVDHEPQVIFARNTKGRMSVLIKSA